MKSEAQAYLNSLASLQKRIRSLQLGLTNGLGPWKSKIPAGKVGVAYGSNVERVTELLLEAAKLSPKVLSMPPPKACIRCGRINLLACPIALESPFFGLKKSRSVIKMGEASLIHTDT